MIVVKHGRNPQLQFRLKNATAEAQMVELRDGVIRTFFRTTTGKIAYMTSRDSGETWSEVSYIDGIQQTSYGTQVSAIKYSHLIDGKSSHFEYTKF